MSYEQPGELIHHQARKQKNLKAVQPLLNIILSVANLTLVYTSCQQTEVQKKSAAIAELASRLSFATSVKTLEPRLVLQSRAGKHLIVRLLNEGVGPAHIADAFFEIKEQKATSLREALLLANVAYVQAKTIVDTPLQSFGPTLASQHSVAIAEIELDREPVLRRLETISFKLCECPLIGQCRMLRFVPFDYDIKVVYEGTCAESTGRVQPILPPKLNFDIPKPPVAPLSTGRTEKSLQPSSR